MLDVQSIPGRISRFWIIRYTISAYLLRQRKRQAQKPRCVVEKIESGYYNVNANIIAASFPEPGSDGSA